MLDTLWMRHNRRKCTTDFKICLDIPLASLSLLNCFFWVGKKAHGKGPSSSEPPKPCMSIGTLKWAKNQYLLEEEEYHQIIWKADFKESIFKFLINVLVCRKSEIVSSEHGRFQSEASSMWNRGVPDFWHFAKESCPEVQSIATPIGSLTPTQGLSRSYPKSTVP